MSVSQISHPVDVDIRDEIAVLCLSQRCNPSLLSRSPLGFLLRTIETLPESVRAAVLHSRGDHFCATLEMPESAAKNKMDDLIASQILHSELDRIRFGRIPIVAVLRGAVVGLGLELACSAHIRVAEDSAYYALGDGSSSMFVGGSGSVRILRVIGSARMMEMALTRRTYDAAEGHSVGFSHYLVKAKEGLATGIALARRIATNTWLSNYAAINAAFKNPG